VGLLQLRPARPAPEIVSDLDALIAKPIAIKLLGRSHTINPINTKEFFEVTAALANLQTYQTKTGIDPSELIDAYAKVFSSVCSTIGRKEVEKMTQAQVAGLVALIINTITGQSHADAQKKNPLSP
jgi:hypothetical protein